MEDQLDLWLVAGAERFGRRDPDLCRALLALAHRNDSRNCLLLLESILKAPGLVDRLSEILRPGEVPPGQADTPRRNVDTPRGNVDPPRRNVDTPRGTVDTPRRKKVSR
jgi:hypothetical protein